jgi:transposase
LTYDRKFDPLFSIVIPVQEENSVEVLRTYTLSLIDEVTRLQKEVKRLSNIIDDSKQIAFADIEDKLTRLKVQAFVQGRERIEKTQITARPVGHRDQELLPHGKRVGPETKEDDASSLLEEVVLHEFTEDGLVDEAKLRGVEPATAEAWEKVEGLFQESREITVIERVYKTRLHRRAKYRLKKEFNQTGKEVLVTAPGPVKLLPGCRYSVEFASQVAADKYDMHLPLERQRRQMEALGLSVSVKTLYGLCRALAELCEKTVVPKIRKEILADFASVHIDETPWALLGGRGGYMWTMSNRSGAYYRFEPTRSGKIAEEMLKGYRGSVLTDGFSGYERVKKLSGVRLAHCWSHARREFYERRELFPKEAEEAIVLIDELFRLERTAEDFANLRVIRREKSTEALARFREWLTTMRTKHLPNSGLTKAIDYCLKLWPGLSLFATDLTVPLTNNDAERALRHVVVGRKNFLGSKSIDGADAAATLYTVIESAKRVGMVPRGYLEYVADTAGRGHNPLSPLELAWALDEHTPTPQPNKNDWKI